MKVKTIDINAKEWFDKVNGNSYFSGTITLNYGTKTAKEYSMPFQYGYGEHYIDMANQLLIKEDAIQGKRHDNGSYPALWQYCKDNKIILRTSKKENCLKKDLTVI
jgi:hypothetical protein